MIDTDIRYIHLSEEDKRNKEKELNADRYRKYKSCICHRKNNKGIVDTCPKLPTDIIEQHLIINPHIIDLSEERLKDIFRKWLIRFYKKELGQYFHKKKDKQLELSINVGYGSSGEKHTHFHIIIQHTDVSFLNRFHEYMRLHLSTYFPRLMYYVKNIDTYDYRVNVYRYTKREDLRHYSNKDLLYTSENTTKEYLKNKLNK